MKTIYTLNVGLLRNDGRGLNRVADTFEALSHNGFNEVVCARIAESATEPALIIAFRTVPKALNRKLNQVCKALAQDCIAIRTPAGMGHLIGPNDKQWGAFNPDYFLDI